MILITDYVSKMKSSTETIIAAMRILAADIQSPDGVANLAIAEAADRLESQAKRIETLQNGLEAIVKHQKLIGAGITGYSTTMLLAERALNYE